VKYSPDGVHISVELDAPGWKRLVLRVRDQGVGIPEHELKRIFRRFYRVTQRSLSQGEGHWPWIVHCAVDRAQSTAAGYFAQSEGAGKGNDRHSGIACEK